MVKCEFCGKEEYLPFKCKYCGGYFCIDHRLPENHNCSPVLQIPEEGEGNNSKKGAAKVEKRPREDVGKNIVPRRIIYDKSSLRAGRLSISKREVAHLFVATVIVLMVVFSSLMYRVFWIFTGWLGGLIFGAIVDSALWLGLIVVVSFLLHEFAHKFVAQMYDLWAEFRLIFSGVLVTLLSILSPLKFLAPGVVMISGPSHWHTVGKTALSGPSRR
ncbi:MAG: AN1-type zinc finger domain-containing protein [Candidatus Freyarchaeota archaeon]